MGEVTSGNYQPQHQFLTPEFESLERAVRPHLARPLLCLLRWLLATLAFLCSREPARLLPSSHSAVCAGNAPTPSHSRSSLGLCEHRLTPTTVALVCHGLVARGTVPQTTHTHPFVLWPLRLYLCLCVRQACTRT